jgi:hypothetical protein
MVKASGIKAVLKSMGIAQVIVVPTPSKAASVKAAPKQAGRAPTPGTSPPTPGAPSPAAVKTGASPGVVKPGVIDVRVPGIEAHAKTPTPITAVEAAIPAAAVAVEIIDGEVSTGAVVAPALRVAAGVLRVVIVQGFLIGIILIVFFEIIQGKIAVLGGGRSLIRVGRFIAVKTVVVVVVHYLFLATAAGQKQGGQGEGKDGRFHDGSFLGFAFLSSFALSITNSIPRINLPYGQQVDKAERKLRKMVPGTGYRGRSGRK